MRHVALYFNRDREDSVAGIVSYFLIEGSLNSGDMLIKYWSI